MKNRHTFCSRSSMRTTPWLDQLQGIDTPTVGPTCPSAIQVTIANDQEGRDPATFALCGRQSPILWWGSSVKLGVVSSRVEAGLVEYGMAG